MVFLKIGWRNNMEVRKALKTDQGTVLFQGELTDEEFDFVLTVGLNELLQQGAIPFHHMVNPEDAVNVTVPMNKEAQ